MGLDEKNIAGGMEAKINDELVYYKVNIKYQLESEFRYKLKKRYPDCSSDAIRIQDNILIVSKGYGWDGPSGPTRDTPDSMWGGLVHDCLYQLMREGKLDYKKYRRISNKEFFLILREHRMNPVRAVAWYIGVSLVAPSSCYPNNPQGKDKGRAIRIPKVR